MTHAPSPPARCVWRFCVLGCAVLAAASAGAIELVVRNNNNSGPGSLRQAIIDNNGLGGGNVIIFSNIVTGTITLTTGELGINTNVTIVGPGPQTLTVSGNNNSRVFNVSGGTAVISGLTIANGRADYGGGVGNSNILQLSNCLFTANVAVADGGTVSSVGTLSVNRCAFIGNGGYNGGALRLGGLASLNNCTIVSNTCYNIGGGIHSFANLTVVACTIVNNASTSFGGGGIRAVEPVTVHNTIIAGNSGPTSGPDVHGSFNSEGYNLIGATNASSGFGAVGDQFGTTASPLNPNLHPLGYYAGSTPTMPPMPGSPAIDQGKSFGLTTDQRGRARPYDNPSIINATLGDGSDIGAVEIGNETLLVTTANDAGPGSLRQAILDASSAEQDTVTFATHVTNVITLTSGPLVINKGLSIRGPGANKLTISGNNASRVFHLTTFSLFLVSDLTIAHGLATNGSGGGILAEAGYLSIVNCQIKSNAATAGFSSGGGIYVAGRSLNLAYSSVTHNQAHLTGGGIAVSGSPQVIIYHSTIASNQTTYVYEGILIPCGGGISLPGGSLFMVNSTVAGNQTTYGGGGVCNGPFTSGTAEIRNSIIAANTAPNSPDVVGPFLSGGYNLIGNPNFSTGFTNATDQVNVNPLLGALGHHGGPTLTMPLQGGSPAIDKGYSFGWSSDQRGVPRPWDDPAIANASGGDGADIGAFEVALGPTLYTFRSGGNVIIAWFPETPGYVLEETTNLTSASWSPAPPGNPTAPIPMAGQGKLYRLRLP
jgi:hypothetical protein